jgi:hypothetical protein
MLFKKQGQSPDIFWEEFEEKTGEKVLAKSIGRYISGWDEFDNNKLSGLWGLTIVQSGGFHFHHFPKTGWFDAMTRFSAQVQPKEKTFFIPRKNILLIEIIKETKWWRKIFNSSVPQLIIIYINEAGEEKRLLLEIGGKTDELELHLIRT